MSYNNIDGYTFYSGLDFVGNDIDYIPNKTKEELAEICNGIDCCMGFNTLGWIKHTIGTDLKPLYGATNNDDGIYIKNIDPVLKKKIAELTSIKQNGTDTGYDITFTITTCKRLERFIETIDQLLINCKNIELIKYWICIDDNSSESDRSIMQEKYPFFTFVWKNLEEKGHAKSMNMLWSTIQTKYVLHFEDDWFCYRPFDLKIIMDNFIKKNYDILTLRKIGHSNPPQIDTIGLDPVFYYVYNANHCLKPELNIDYDNNNYSKDGVEYQYSNTEYWWWPGFTLNPSIYDFKKIKEQVGYFNDSIQQELFEYDYALRCYYSNIEPKYINLNIEHTGTVSSYALNDMKRYYD